MSVPWHTNKCIDRYTLLARPRLKVQQSPASWTGRANRLASRDNAYTLDRKDRFERKRWLVEHQCLPEFFFTFFSSFSAGLLFFLPLVVVRVPPPPLGSRAPRVVNLLSSPFPLPFSLPPSLTLTCEPGTPFGSRGTVHRHGTHANSPIEMASLGCVGLACPANIKKIGGRKYFSMPAPEILNFSLSPFPISDFFNNYIFEKFTKRDYYSPREREREINRLFLRGARRCFFISSIDFKKNHFAARPDRSFSSFER